jgi:hypothetical protein
VGGEGKRRRIRGRIRKRGKEGENEGKETKGGLRKGKVRKKGKRGGKGRKSGRRGRYEGEC